MNNKISKTEIFMELAEFLATAATGAVSGAMIAQKFHTLTGMPMNVSQKIGDAFEISFGGRGTQQEELNNWLALCGLMQWEEVAEKLPPGMTANDCIERLANWTIGLMPKQRRLFVLTFGMLFGDVRKTLQPTVATTTPFTATPSPVSIDAFKLAQKEAAETLLPLLWLHDDKARTKEAIAFGLIPKHDWPFEAWEWLKEVETHKKMWVALRTAGKGIGKGTVAVAKYLATASNSPEMQDNANKINAVADKLDKWDVLGRLFKKIF